MTAAGRSWTTWWLEPRDPVVFGDGARTAALAPRHPAWLPPQTTIAGFVRSQFVAAGGRVSEQEARRTLAIRIRGPWLAQKGCEHDIAPQLWLPAPGDLAVAQGKLYRGELLELQEEEGFLWPEGTESELFTLAFPARDREGHKTRPLSFPYLPFATLVCWSLGADIFLPGTQPVQPEYRVHVALDDAALTAEPEALFSSAGLRFAAGFGLAVEVEASRSADPGPRLVVLGAESRTSSCSLRPGSCFPTFSENFKKMYRWRIAELEQSGAELGLRLQLITPGSFGGWQPCWREPLAGRLRGIAMERYAPVSGWNLNAGRPRQVRRLVAPGALYFFGPFEPEKLYELCEEYWGAVIGEDAEGEPEQLLARPADDGYGRVLPAPCSIPRRRA